MKLALFTILVLLTPFFAGAATTITGPSSICTGDTATLIGSPRGGTWTSGSTSIASIGASTGIVYGVSPGTVTIAYRPPASSTSGVAYFTMTVGGASAGTVSGPSTVCLSGSITLTPSISGGSWSTSASSIASVDASGVVYGIAIGSAVISYTVSASCGSSVATHAVTVSTGTTTVPPISGASSVCIGGSTLFTDAASGGTWSTSSATIASVSATGSVYGVAVGSATITYTITSGCGSASATRAIAVEAPLTPPAAIAGPHATHVSASISLINSTPGGTWSSNAPGVATVSTAGTVTGVSVGSAVITYQLSNSCGSVNDTNLVVVTSTAEVASLSNALAASVYPNPSKGVFNIRFSAPLSSQGTLAVRDLTGRIIYTAKVVAGAANTTIDLNDVANGLYFLEVITFDGRSQHKVVVDR